MSRLRSFFVAWDFGLAVLATATYYAFAPRNIGSALLKPQYLFGVVACLFVLPLFCYEFRELLRLRGEEFVRWLDEDGAYTELLWSLKVSGAGILLATLYSLGVYAWTANQIIAGVSDQSRYYSVAFVFLLGYGLGTFVEAMFDFQKFYSFRARFCSLKRRTRGELPR